MSKKLYLVVTVFLSYFHVFYAQWNHIPVFPDLQDVELKDSLLEKYALVNALSDQRDTLFAKVDGISGKLTCIYTDYTITLNPNADPTQDAFSKGINTEHCYPKSKGAGDNSGEFNMHHLFPAKEDVNNYRASKPFHDIPDNLTQHWYYLTNDMSSIPTQNIDLYSEGNSEAFEPSEAQKGNIARAMMYFYTFYTNQANAQDPNFFWDQLDELCTWHFEDPVDEDEWNRTFAIAKYQEDKPNPFVLDCSVAARLYCNEISQECKILDTKNGLTTDDNIKINYLIENSELRITNITGNSYSFAIYNSIGNLLSSVNVPASQSYFSYDLSSMKGNQMFYVILQLDGMIYSKAFLKL